VQIAVHYLSSCLPATLCIHGLINNNKTLYAPCCFCFMLHALREMFYKSCAMSGSPPSSDPVHIPATSPVAAKQPLPDWQSVQFVVHYLSSCQGPACCPVHPWSDQQHKMIDK
jgi:hypothetical protein